MDRSTDELLEVIRITELISANLHGLTHEEEIIEALIGPFRASRQFHAHLMMAEEGSDRLRFVATSFSPALVKLGEAVAGVSMSAFTIDPLQVRLLDRIIRDGETVLVSTVDALESFLPSSVAPRILKRMGYEGTLDVLTPIHRNGDVVGILSVTAPGLAELFIPSVKNLARHVGAALGFATSYHERQHAERLYQELIESLNEIFYIADSGGRITYVSPNVSRIGLDRDVVLGAHFSDLFEGNQLEAIEERFRAYLSGELSSGHAIYRIRPKEGEPRWIRISSRVITEEGRRVGLRGTIADVSEEKRGEEALAESERILNQTGRMAKIGGWEHDLATGTAVWTEELYRIIELEPGRRPPGVDEHLDYYPEPDRTALERAYRRAIEEGVPFDLELQVLTATGRTIWCRAYGEPVHEGGTCVKMRGTFQNITARRTAEIARMESDRRLATLMSNLPGMAYRCRNVPEWTMEFVSDGSEALTGYAPQDLIEDRVVSYGSLIHPDDLAQVWNGVQQAVATDRPFRFEYRIRSADGTEKWVWEQGQALYHDGKVLALEGFMTDVTGRVEAARRRETLLSGAIRAVARTAELRDPYTAGHQERVANLACLIAERMGADTSSIEALRVAGLLHDIGKIAVPSEILSKPSTLSDVEMALVRSHVEASREILEGIDFPWPILEMVSNHHERLDGSGYPCGLRGESISLGARILAVADTVEAMSSHRPYRPALGIDIALREIEEGRGTRYDPAVVDACISLVHENGADPDALFLSLRPTPPVQEPTDQPR